MTETCSTCGSGLLQKTGFKTLTMPIMHERKCGACGSVVWCLPVRFGESFEIAPHSPDSTAPDPSRGGM